MSPQQESFEDAAALRQDALRLVGEGKYDEALAGMTRLLSIIEQVRGPDHPDFAQVLSGIATIHWVKGDYQQGALLYQRALDTLEKTLGPDNVQLGPTLLAWGKSYLDNGRADLAEPLLTRTLSLYEAALPPDDPRIGETLTALAEVQYTVGRYDKAETQLNRARIILEGKQGSNPMCIAEVFSLQARLYQHKGDYNAAERLFQRTAEILEKTQGRDSTRLAQELTFLGCLHQDTGKYTQAESLFQEARGILERKEGPDSIHIVGTLYGLARLYLLKADYTPAEPLLWKCLGIAQRFRSKDHPDIALYYNGLGALYLAKSELNRSEDAYRRTLAIWQKSLGDEHPSVAAGHYNLGIVYEQQGDYRQAESFYRQSLSIWEKIRPDHPEMAGVFSRLGDLSELRGKHHQAEQLFERAVAIWQKALGSSHPSVAVGLNQLAVHYEHRGDIDQSLNFMARANEIWDNDLRRTLLTGSEGQKRAYLSKLLGNTNRTISLHLQSAFDNPRAGRLAFQTVLRRKGCALDAQVDMGEILRNHLDQEGKRLVEELGVLRDLRARLYLRGSLAEYPASEGLVDKLQADFNQDPEGFNRFLDEEIDDIDQQLALKSVSLRSEMRTVSIDSVQREIPQDGALVEIVAYFPRNREALPKKDLLTPRRYAAYILHADGTFHWVELGRASIIDHDIEAFHRLLSHPTRQEWKKQSRILYQRLITPIVQFLGNTRHLLLSPEGALNMIPFEALLDEKGHPLIERYTVTYLTTGRELLRQEEKTKGSRVPVVVAGADYDAVIRPDLTVGEGKDREAKAMSAPQRATEFKDFLPFSQLGGAKAEGEALKTLLPNALLLSGVDASESLVKVVEAPQILHIATHGFFLPDIERPKAGKEVRVVAGSGAGRGVTLELTGVERDPVWDPLIGNPLLRSGLALAGVNRGASGGNDGILTALEAAGLDLVGTQLVVLSACETGLGAVRFGDGVYGLRRALVLAGAETLVLTLWKVADAVTRDLMVHYYTYLLAGEGRSEALRHVKLDLLQSAEYGHPYYWAAFILSGNWKPITGNNQAGVK